MPRRVNRRYMSKARRRRRLLYLAAGVIAVVVLVIAGMAIGRGHGKQTASAGSTSASGGKPASEATAGGRTPKPVSTAWTGPPSSSTHLKLKKVIISSQIS